MNYIGSTLFASVLWASFLNLLNTGVDGGLARVKRVIGGQADTSGDTSFLAALIGSHGYEWDHLRLWGDYRKVYCSGTIVADQWIVTAAHCFSGVEEFDPEERWPDSRNDFRDDGSSDYDLEEQGLGEEAIALNNNDSYFNIPRYNGFNNIQFAASESSDNYNSNRTMFQEIVSLLDPEDWKVRLSVRKLQPSITETIMNLWNHFIAGSNKKTYYKVSQIIMHPKYIAWNLEYDIALIKLAEKIDLKTSRIMALADYPKVNQSWPLDNQMCKVIGWGCSKVKGPVLDEPHSVMLPIISPQYCRTVFRADINLTVSQEFCAGYYDQNVGICPGDSGGPLVCTDGNTQKLAGVVSAAHIYEPKKFPGIFSRVSHFRHWIEKTINSNYD